MSIRIATDDGNYVILEAGARPVTFQLECECGCEVGYVVDVDMTTTTECARCKEPGTGVAYYHFSPLSLPTGILAKSLFPNA